jgi:O-antigen/teichoic acid export membrane protein
MPEKIGTKHSQSMPDQTESPRGKLLPFMQDMLWTGGSSIVTALALLIVTAITTRMLTAEEFGAFAFARQIAATLIALPSLSMALALPRYASLDPTSAGYVSTAVFLGIGAALLVLTFGWLSAPMLGNLLFHYSSGVWMFRSMLVLVVGLTAFRLLYAMLRLNHQIGYANAWKVAVTGILPIASAIAAAPTGNGALVLGCMGAGASICLVPVLRNALYDFRVARLSGIAAPVRRLVAYGLPRTPGGMLRSGIFTIGFFFAPYVGGLDTVAHLAIGYYAVRLAEALLAGFSNAALHRVSHALHKRGHDFVRQRSEDLLGFSVGISLYVTFQLLVWADEIVLVWVGPDYADAIPLVRGMAFAITPYVAYVLLRSVVDSIRVQAVNTLNLLIAFSCVAGLSLIAVKLQAGGLGLVGAFVIGIFVLGISTILYLRKHQGLLLKEAMIHQSFALSAIFGGVSYLADVVISKTPLNSGATMVFFLAVQLTLGVFFIAALKYLRIRWIEQLWRRLPTKFTSKIFR